MKLVADKETVAFDIEGTLTEGMAWEGVRDYLVETGEEARYKSFQTRMTPRYLLYRLNLGNKQAFKNGAGFEIVSVGIERSKERWIKAIQKDGLFWPYHVSELKRLSSSEAEAYKVREIPTKFLINPEGFVIGVNQPIRELDKYLEGQWVKN